MKGMLKGKILKKLKTIKAIGYLKPDKILYVNASDGNVYTSPQKSNTKAHTPLASLQEEPKRVVIQSNVQEQEPEVIDVSELMKDLEDQEMDSDECSNDKENIRPEKESKSSGFLKENAEALRLSEPKNEALEVKELERVGCGADPLVEIDVSNFRRPDLDSGTLFDPNLLAVFEQAVMEVKAQEAERRARIEEKISRGIEDEPPLKARKIEECTNPLLDFEEKCPPGGSDSVILYTTGLRGIRKTFKNCQSIRFLLENFRVLFFERDVSMHSEYREELWKILGGKVVPPKLFVKGRYIGGAEEVLALHEQGKFRPLFEGIPIDHSQGHCETCSGIRFIMCFNCNGSRKKFSEDDGESIKCSNCNENGLIVCPLCC